MANKTIYIRDESIWDDAKELAAKEDMSISSVIERALRNYIVQHGAEIPGLLERRRAALKLLLEMANEGLVEFKPRKN